MSTHGDFQLSEDVSLVDWARVHLWLASSYWSPGISREWVERAARNSALVVGAYWNREQAGYLRVISDTARWAYLCDVWVDATHRGKGLGRAMVRYALEHPEFARVKWLLATADAHGVYANLGFETLKEPHRWMQRAAAQPMDPP